MVVAATQAHAYPFHSVIDRMTGRAPPPPAAAPLDTVAQAHCYGRYVAWRDTLADAIQSTNAWPTSGEPVAEFDKIQAAFVASAATERGVSVRLSPDLDETALPADIRIAYDRGAQEAKTRLAGAVSRAGQADPADPGPERMAHLQAALDSAFAPMRAPCVHILDPRRGRHGAPQITPVRDEPAAIEPAPDGAAASMGDGWDGPEWIQIGVFDHASASGEQLDAFRARWSRETVGLSEKTEAVSHDGKVLHVALVGPFVHPADARAFCAKLAARGDACTVHLTNAATRGKARRKASPVRAAARHAPHAAAPHVVLISNPSANLARDHGLRGRLAQ
jgi:hypothetical protein